MVQIFIVMLMIIITVIIAIGLVTAVATVAEGAEQGHWGRVCLSVRVLGSLLTLRLLIRHRSAR